MASGLAQSLAEARLDRGTVFEGALGMMKPLLRITIALAALAAAASPAFAQKVRLTTSMGDVVIELDAARAPKTVDNFVQYVKAGHYDGTVFHRVIDGFMIQGGGMTADMKEKSTRAPIALESRNGLSNQLTKAGPDVHERSPETRVDIVREHGAGKVINDRPKILVAFPQRLFEHSNTRL